MNYKRCQQSPVYLFAAILMFAFGCKEGRRQIIKPGEICFATDSNGLPVAVPCEDSGTQPDATLVDDASVDGSQDAMVDGEVRFMLPTNACLDDAELTIEEPDGGADAGEGMSVLVAGQIASFDPSAIGGCLQSAMGFGPAFIQCLANFIIAEVPQITEDCPLCLAATLDCIISKCENPPIGATACVFDDPQMPTDEELETCGRCQCENGCLLLYDNCTGFGGTELSENAFCLPPGDAGMTDGGAADAAMGDAAMDDAAMDGGF